MYAELFEAACLEALQDAYESVHGCQAQQDYEEAACLEALQDAYDFECMQKETN